MTKQNPSTIKEQRDVIVEAIAKQLRIKNLNAESIGVLDAKGAIDYLPRDMASKDAPCDVTAHLIENTKRKTDVKG